MAEVSTIFIGESPVTPLGNVWVANSERGLVAVEFQTDRQTFIHHVLKLMGNTPVQISLNAEKSASALRQISEYLDGERRYFDLPIDWSVMTPFQAKVLRLTYAIPYGDTATYGMIATRLGNPKAARAVGRAQATNPMPLVIPCHRVLGSDGGLHGYGAANGIESKAWLLELESTD
jgi:methylated-DNA-[protein]-cysteine S-methyltransferase